MYRLTPSSDYLLPVLMFQTQTATNPRTAHTKKADVTLTIRDTYPYVRVPTPAKATLPPLLQPKPERPRTDFSTILDSSWGLDAAGPARHGPRVSHSERTGCAGAVDAAVREVIHLLSPSPRLPWDIDAQVAMWEGEVRWYTRQQSLQEMRESKYQQCTATPCGQLPNTEDRSLRKLAYSPQVTYLRSILTAVLPVVDPMWVHDPHDDPAQREREWKLFPSDLIAPSSPISSRVELPLRIVETAHGPSALTRPTRRIAGRTGTHHPQSQGGAIAVENEDGNTFSVASDRRAAPGVARGDTWSHTYKEY